MPEGLRVVGRNLSTSNIAPSRPRAPPTGLDLPGPAGSLFQMPHFYWNHLNAVDPQPAIDESGVMDFNFASPDMAMRTIDWVDPRLATGMSAPDQSQSQRETMAPASMNWQNGTYPDQTLSGGGGSGGNGADNEGVYMALMSYMTAATSRQ
jgi:hypothetical protein